MQTLIKSNDEHRNIAVVAFLIEHVRDVADKLTLKKLNIEQIKGVHIYKRQHRDSWKDHGKKETVGGGRGFKGNLL